MGTVTTLHHLAVDNFRSHTRAEFALGPVTVFVGPNGAGKTNLLESLWFLATTRSFRTNHDAELIRWDAPAAQIIGDQYEIRLVQQPVQRKLLFINGVARRPLDYLGELRAVLFTPDSLQIISGAPGQRRRFLDTLLAQADRQNARDLVAYRHVLTERNALLRLIGLNRASPDELLPWNDQLVRLGSRLTAQRLSLVEDLRSGVAQNYHLFGGDAGDALTVAYQATGSPNPDLFAAQLERLYDREVRFQVTLVGPHRDDLLLELRNRPISEHGSRGEMRTALLALKSAEYLLLQTKTASAEPRLPPLLLLDDLFSELDQDHREALTDFLESAQTVITTTEMNYLPSRLHAVAVAIELGRSA